MSGGGNEDNLNTVNNKNSGNIVNIVNSVQAVYSAVLPPSLMVFLISMIKTLKASMRRNATEKGSGPKKALSDIGMVIESRSKKAVFS